MKELGNLVVPTKTEDRILQSALQHFCNFGYNGTSVREITAASRVTKPTLYYYFKNKEELFTRLAQSSFEKVLAKIENIKVLPNQFDANVLALFQSMESIASMESETLKFIHGLVLAPQKGVPDVGAKAFLGKIDLKLNEILDQAVLSGECAESKKIKLQVLLAALLGYYTKSIILVSETDLTDQKVLQSIIKHLLDSSRSV